VFSFLTLFPKSLEMIPCTAAIALVVALNLAQYTSLAAAAGGGPRVIIVGAGMSGKHALSIPNPPLSLPCVHRARSCTTYRHIMTLRFVNAGISAGKRLCDAGMTDLLILEATDHVGGRMHKQNFAGINVEVGANWVEGVNGGKMNPIWPIVNSTLMLRNFRSDFDHLAQNVYKEEYVLK
jgi:polyamine oxidase